MGKTSSKVKDRYNAKVYDTILTRLPKGQKAQIQAHAAEQGESNGAGQRKNRPGRDGLTKGRRAVIIKARGRSAGSSRLTVNLQTSL